MPNRRLRRALLPRPPTITVAGFWLLALVMAARGRPMSAVSGRPAASMPSPTVPGARPPAATRQRLPARSAILPTLGADGAWQQAREARTGAVAAAEVITVDVWYGCSIMGVWTR